MAVPTSPSVSNIYNEANGTTPGGVTRVGELFRYSYFEGPNGNSTIGYNAWGQYGGSSGANRIYGLSASNSNLHFGDYRSLLYTYDSTTYFIPYSISNTAPPPGPPPPEINDVNVTIALWDSTMTYFYLQQTYPSMAGGATVSGTLEQPNITPLIYNGYWQVIYDTQPQANANLQADLSINGTSKYTNLSLAAGATTSSDWNTYGSELVATYSPGKIGLQFNITIHI